MKNSFHPSKQKGNLKRKSDQKQNKDKGKRKKVTSPSI